MSLKTRIELQNYLINKGFAVGGKDGKPDGVIGKVTKQAILSCFQNKNAKAITDAERLEFAKRLGDTNIKRIKAVAAVETTGAGWFNDGRPKILYERHKFYQYNDEPKAPLSEYFNWAKSGNYTVDADKNGINDSYDKLLKACEYDPKAAFMSVSMGMFQVMGYYYDEMGFDSPYQMLFDCVNSEKAQYQLLVGYIEMNKLQSKFLALSTDPKTCAPFALAYNGKNYAVNKYDEKLAASLKVQG